jgi:hypothetical protein
MSSLLKEGEIELGYYSSTREYYIWLKEHKAIQLINFCPWCGKHLPCELSNEYYEILQEEYQLHDPDGIDKFKIPLEFQTDEWWKKRGL